MAVPLLERVVNDYSTTITSAFASGASPAVNADFPVASTTDAFSDAIPATGQFRVRIDTEILTVTRAGAAASNLKVVERGSESTTAAAHSNGATVEAVVTAGGIDGVAPRGTRRTKKLSSYYYMPDATVVANHTVVLDRLFFVPVAVPPDMTANRISVEVVTAGPATGVERLGIYADLNGLPGALILDAGTVPLDGAAALKEITISQALPTDGGYVWLAAAGQVTVTSALLRGQSTIPSWPGGQLTDSITVARFAVYLNGISGALPDPAFSPGAETWPNANGPRVAVRAA